MLPDETEDEGIDDNGEVSWRLMQHFFIIQAVCLLQEEGPFEPSLFRSVLLVVV